MKVIYPVLFYEEEKGEYSVFVPDLLRSLHIPASTCGDSLEKAMEMAEDLIAGIVLDDMEEGNKIPQSRKIEDVTFDELEKDSLIERSKKGRASKIRITKFGKKYNLER